MKKVLFVASESVPFIKTGGLADVVGSLPKYFDKNQTGDILSRVTNDVDTIAQSLNQSLGN